MVFGRLLISKRITQCYDKFAKKTQSEISEGLTPRYKKVRVSQLPPPDPQLVTPQEAREKPGCHDYTRGHRQRVTPHPFLKLNFVCVSFTLTLALVTGGGGVDETPPEVFLEEREVRRSAPPFLQYLTGLGKGRLGFCRA